jgi:alpha-L-arabinofuranosidase
MMIAFNTPSRACANSAPTLFLAVSLVYLSACGAQTQGEVGAKYSSLGAAVNQTKAYPVTISNQALKCTIDVNSNLGQINPHIFGTNLEWFNEAGGLASQNTQLKKTLVDLTKQQGVTVMRYPGGILADYYHWKDGIGELSNRPRRKHPTDSGSSENAFGSPEFFNFLKATNSQGLVTVNAGTGTAQEAAEWVRYANESNNPLRLKDGLSQAANIKLWEIGNELYYPGNPGEEKIGLNPQEYAKRYLAFSRAMKAVDPNIKTIAIGVAKSHIGPDTQYQDWTKVLLQQAASEIDMIAVHNAYFPMLYTERQPPVEAVYPALWASPEAVDRSLSELEQLIKQYEGKQKIGIAITEWGQLFSFPNVDNYWVDHVKTMGSGVYVGRMLQVMMSHERLQLANYFKLTDRSFMGWINYEGQPKVPFWVFALYANHTGDIRLSSTMDSPRYDTKQMGIIAAEKQVPEVTVFSSKDSVTGKVFVNLVNRSMTTSYPVNLNLLSASKQKSVKVYRVQAREMTAHNGRDIPPEWPYDKAYEPYSSAAINSIKIVETTQNANQAIVIAPFSVLTVVIETPDIKTKRDQKSNTKG